nr:EOG090X0GY1 [Triops cancriformis]
MPDSLQENLSTYRLQLQQVEAALTTDPGNEELVKLQTDLLEVINLTKELLRAQEGEDSTSSAAPTFDFEAADNAPVRTWKIGEKCMAKWSNDGKYYPATIEEITNDGEVSVRFDAYGNTDITRINLLKERPSNAELDTKKMTQSLKNKRAALQQQREYLKKRKQKKQQRMKVLEDEREKEKNKWQNFATKSTKKKGVIKKSIFATTEHITGRVGVGTCGVSGKPMTEYSAGEKLRKGAI